MAVMPQAIDLNINGVTQKIIIDVNVIGYNGWLIRLKIAILLIRMACWIANVQLKVK